MVLQVCGSGVELACAPARSLWPTLASAASTLALFLGANWNLAWVISEIPAELKTLCDILFVFTMPLLPLVIGLNNVLKVYSVRQSINRKKMENKNVEDACIPILAICPLVIEIPMKIPQQNPQLDLETLGYKVLKQKDVSDKKKLKNALKLEPMVIEPQSDSDQQPHASASNDETTYLQHEVSLFDTNSMKKLRERELLLELGLAPEYSQLRYMRSRGTFQVVVTLLQASGYVFSVVQRLAQHLAICPLEAFLGLLSAIIVSQFLLELYACSHYQCPLVLRLNRQQFSEFWDNHNPSTEGPEKRASLSMLFFVYWVLSILLSCLSISYAIQFIHSCQVCFIALLLFTLSLLSWSLFLVFLILSCFISCIKPSRCIGGCWCFGFITTSLFTPVLFIFSLLVALVSTATHWDLFHSPTHNSFSWILPHVSGQA